jgi:ATP-dependent DNA helicase DinG
MTALLAEVFSASGPLAAAVPGYRPRQQQLELAASIAAAMAGNRVLVAEAGTGTGKTYAYLVPALLSGGKVIVSTGTRNLQDQLFGRDIPTIRKALKSAGQGRPAQGARQLPLPPSSRARARRWPISHP